MFNKVSFTFLILILLACFQTSICDTDDTLQVYIDNDEFKGSIVGRKIKESNVEYIAFRGIPYAKPPINELRFKDPQKLPKFEGILDATHDGYECCSITSRNESEDCLNLNVYTKQLNTFTLLPVLVLIHPGGLYLGSGASFYMNPSHMMLQDIVLVTFNYRLGTLGFLNLGTPEIPGNAGFKDQVFVLRWVEKHIQNFGGNSQDVTLMGYSAGALSVQFHLISPMSKTLFHKAIIMSGTIVPQAYLPQRQQKYLAVRQAKRLKCEKFLDIEEEIPYGIHNKFSNYEEVKDKDILECLNRFNASVISQTLRQMFDYPKDNPLLLWLPVVENDFKQERFLTENLDMARKNTLIGYTNGELCLSSKEILQVESVRKNVSKNFKTFAPRTFMYERHLKSDIITTEIYKKYFNNSKEFTARHYDALCDLFSDSFIRFGSHKLAEFFVQHGGTVYFYEFTFVDFSQQENDGFQDKQVRCDHMNDFQYLFNWLGRGHHTEQQKKVVQLYTGFIYDFMKNGKLSHGKAKPYPQSYALINENIEYKEGRNFNNYEFWTQLFPHYFNYKLN